MIEEFEVLESIYDTSIQLDIESKQVVFVQDRLKLEFLLPDFYPQSSVINEIELGITIDGIVPQHIIQHDLNSVANQVKP